MSGLMPRAIPTVPQDSRGFTLLEVLIALVVLSVGALGLLSLAGLSTGYQHDAIFRSRAVAAAEDLSGRVRANPPGLAAYAGTGLAAGCTSSQLPAVRCDPDTLAGDDLAGWHARHLRGLPDASAVIRVLPDQEPPALELSLSWQSRGRFHHLSRRLGP
jgi:type IV pilus assembly protein PilV